MDGARRLHELVVTPATGNLERPLTSVWSIHTLTVRVGRYLPTFTHIMLDDHSPTHCAQCHKLPRCRLARFSAGNSLLHVHKLCSSLACSRTTQTTSFSMTESSRLPLSHVSLTLSLIATQPGNHGSTCAFSAKPEDHTQYSPHRDTASTPHIAQHAPAVNVWSASPSAMDMP